MTVIFITLTREGFGSLILVTTDGGTCVCDSVLTSLTFVTMTQLRDLENIHHEKVSDVAVVTLEKLMKNELEEELPDDLRMV